MKLTKNEESTMHPIDIGRLRMAMKYLHGLPGLNIGSGKVRLENKLNTDIVDNGKTDVDMVMSVLDMSRIDDGSISEVVFTDTIEHIPCNTEVRALKEIERVLEIGGRMVLSTPHKLWWAILLDPVWWFNGHRHYSVDELLSFFAETDLEVEHIYTSGTFPWGVVTIAYAVNWALRRKRVDLFKTFVIEAYARELGMLGATVFIVAKKVR